MMERWRKFMITCMKPIASPRVILICPLVVHVMTWRAQLCLSLQILNTGFFHPYIYIHIHHSLRHYYIYSPTHMHACNSYISFFHIVLGNPQPKRLPVVALHQKDPASANQVFSFPSLLHAGKLSDQVVNLMSVVVNTISKHLYQCKGKRAGTRFCLLG